MGRRLIDVFDEYFAMTHLRSQIAALLVEGQPRAAIAAALGCSLSAVDQVARQAGPGKRGRPATGQREQARALRAAGLTHQAIAAELGISRQRVSRLLSDGK